MWVTMWVILAVFLSLYLLQSFLEGGNAWWGFLPSLLIIATLSFLDDRNPLSAEIRLFWHILAAVLFLVLTADHSVRHASEESETLNGLLLAIKLCTIVWMLNLYNFMDGMDGLASAMGVIGFAGIALIAAAHEGHDLAKGALLLASACCGFWFVNAPPGKLFMGDVGSTSLGFMAAALGSWANDTGKVPWWATMLIFAPFIVDASWTLGRRFLRGAPLFQAHREHLYQRLLASGYSSWQILGIYYMAMLCCVGAAFCLSTCELSGW
ncbi:MAG: hypothetical protein HQM04_10140 [Magnetococcales bacterium]|nr:hypothetical protein [Magnetococcales bacterium]MBF0115390.1 hypothetical protein [Magnetococcales bacterium]